MCTEVRGLILLWPPPWRGLGAWSEAIVNERCTVHVFCAHVKRAELAVVDVGDT